MSLKKPVIGIVPLWDEDKDSLWMLPGYPDGVAAAGGLPITLPLTSDEDKLDQLMDMCDGFLYTGGQDVSPDIYGEKKISECGNCCRKRDLMEQKLLEKAILSDKPLLGICRGIQFINAALGGSLYQDIGTLCPSEVEHHMSPPYDKVQHRVSLVEGTPIHKLLKKDSIGVNSYHHQAVCVVAPELEVMAWSEDGLAEGLYRPESTFLWAIQWHPELSYLSDCDSLKIFKALIEASSKN